MSNQSLSVVNRPVVDAFEQARLDYVAAAFAARDAQLRDLADAILTLSDCPVLAHKARAVIRQLDARKRT